MTISLAVGAIRSDVVVQVQDRLAAVLGRRRAGARVHRAAHGRFFESLGGPREATSLLGFTDMLEHAAEEHGLSHLGLEMARLHEVQHSGPLIELFTHAPTLGQALTDLVRFFPAVQTQTAVSLVREGASARFIYRIRDLSISQSLQDASYTLGKLHRALQRAAGRTWQLEQVTMAMPVPPQARAWQAFFEAPVVFNAPLTSLCFPAALLDVAIPGADPQRHAIACDTLQRRLPDAGDTRLLQDALRAWMLHAARHARAVTLEQAAADFGTTPRTLQRRLKELQIHFVDLRAQVRMQVARDLLAQGSLPITRIAGLLGFSETSAFTRAFRTHNQLSPRAFRQTTTLAGGAQIVVPGQVLN
ncbi:MAG: AraC family transcriptional regulator ligand-binding domain-containing protein [Burkholderiaceae bacterium]|nr:AraC family transcriptional regulator ligand-binding domain-containing protein [Burkholderiaceae bacterium]